MKTYICSVESDLQLPPNSYVYNISPTSTQHDVRSQHHFSISSSDHLVTSSSDNSLRVLDPETLKLHHVISDTHSSITSLKRYAQPGTQCSTFMTSGRDGVVRGWDMRTQNKALEFSSPNNEPLSALDCDTELQAVVAGTELEGDAPGNVSIFGWDVRMPGSSVGVKYVDSHNDTVTELRFLPKQGERNTLLLSAGTDGLVNVFDTSIAEEEDALLQVVKSTSALQHAGLLDGDFFTIGTDETASFHAWSNPETEDQDPAPCLLGDVREKFECDYVVNMYQSGAKPYLAVGSYSNQWLDLIRFKNKAENANEARSWKAASSDDKRIRLAGGHGEEIVRDVLLTEDLGVVYTCGEDGKVRVWRSDGDADGDVDMGGTVTGKKRKGDRKERKEKRAREV